MTGSRTVPGPKSPKKKISYENFVANANEISFLVHSSFNFTAELSRKAYETPICFVLASILHIQVEMKLHCCLNSFVSSLCFDAFEISSHFPVKSKNEMKIWSISLLNYAICTYSCCPCKKIIFMTIAMGFDLLRYGFSFGNFLLLQTVQRMRWVGTSLLI